MEAVIWLKRPVKSIKFKNFKNMIFGFFSQILFQSFKSAQELVSHYDLITTSQKSKSNVKGSG